MSATKPISTTTAFQVFQVMRLGSAVLTGVVLAKSGLGLTDIGIYEMLLYVGTTLSFFWVSGFLQGIGSLYVKSEETLQKSFVFQVFFIFIAISLLLSLVLWFGQSWILPLLTGQKSIPYFGLFAIYLGFNLPTFPVEIIYLIKNKAITMLWWGIFIFGLHLCAVALPLWVGWGLQGSLFALIVLAVLKFLWTMRVMFQWGNPILDFGHMQQYLVFCLPLMAGTLVGNLMLFWDNWLVNWYYHDVQNFAIFRFGAREFPLALALCTGLGTALVPVLSQSLVMGMGELKAKGLRLMHLLFPLAIVLMLVSKPLFPLVFNSDFAKSAPIFNIFLIITATRVLLPGSIVLALGQTQSIFWISILELGIRIALSLAFIPYFGLEGVAWAVVLSFWIEKIGLIWILESRHQVKTSDWLAIPWYLFYTTLLLATVWHCN